MIGSVVGGRYTLRSVLAEGGMATIYRGWDSQLEREVAVKLLRPQYGSDPEFVTRFRQEARSAGSLSHPNIVGVHDYGSEDGAQFIVMELVEGRDLAAVIRDHAPLAVQDAVEIAIQAAAGLEAAHRRGIVHRDVKPANILLTHDGHVRVADFGIARAVAEAGLTTTGTTLGSVHYFSPEQARGEEVTAASDVYALAIVLYEMLTGRRPFEGDSAAAIALRRLSHPPSPPTSYNATLPPALVAIVMRALQLDQRARHPSAGVFRQALQDWHAAEARGGESRAVSALPALSALSATGPRGAAGAVEEPEPPSGIDDAVTPAEVAAAAVAAPTVLQPPEGLAVHAATDAEAALESASAAPPRQAERDNEHPRPAWLWATVIVAGLALLAGLGFLGAQLLGGSNVTAPTATTESEGVAEATAQVTESAVPARSASPSPVETPAPTSQNTLPPIVTTPPPPVEPTPVPEPEPPPAPAMDPAETVVHWYGLVADQQFDAAYALWSDQMKANYPRQTQLDGRWDDTDEVVVHSWYVNYVDEEAGLANVYIEFTEIKNSGAQSYLAGSWDLVMGPEGWLLNQPRF